MDARDHGEHAASTNGTVASLSPFCRLEWIALAIDAAHRHKEDQQRIPPAIPRRPLFLVRFGPVEHR
jgi:hypothetical protein